MVSKVLFFSGFGLAVRFWQLGIQMRPFFLRQSLWAYPVYAGFAAGFGYWLQGVEDRQMRILTETRERLLEKRRRRAERDGELSGGSAEQKGTEALLATPELRQAA